MIEILKINKIYLDSKFKLLLILGPLPLGKQL